MRCAVRHGGTSSATFQYQLSDKSLGKQPFMTENVSLKCPLCEGHGEISRAQLAEKLTSPALRQRLDARIAEILEECELAASHASPSRRDFQKEVHSWNPELPMWRRSPKE